MPDLIPFKQYSELAAQLVAAATKEQLAECAKILALNVAHSNARFGEAPTDDLTAALRGGTITDETAAILGDGMGGLVGVLGTVMGLDQPQKLN